MFAHIVVVPWLSCLAQLAFPRMLSQHWGTFREVRVPHWGIKVEQMRGLLMVHHQYQVTVVDHLDVHPHCLVQVRIQIRICNMSSNHHKQ